MQEIRPNKAVAALGYMFDYFGVLDQGRRFAIYCDLLADDITQYGEDELDSLIRESCKKFRKLPTVSEILEPLKEAQKAKLKQAEDEFIDKFRRTWRNNLGFEEIPDDVYTVKRMIGLQRCDNARVEDQTWIIKEAREIYRRIQKGEVKLLSDPKKGCYHQLDGGGTMLLDNPTENKGLEEIGGLIGISGLIGDGD